MESKKGSSVEPGCIKYEITKITKDGGPHPELITKDEDENMEIFLGEVLGFLTGDKEAWENKEYRLKKISRCLENIVFLKDLINDSRYKNVIEKVERFLIVWRDGGDFKLRSLFRFLCEELGKLEIK